MSTETTTPPRWPTQYWRKAVQLPPRGAGLPTKGLLVAHYAAMAQAHFSAYDEALTGAHGVTVQAAVAAHFDPGVAAFTAAAALQGLDIRGIQDAIDDGSEVLELIWEWLDDWNPAAGTTDALVASLTTAPAVTA